MKKRPPYNQNAQIRSAVRRTFSRSPIVREVLMQHRREVPKYNKDGSRSKKDSVQYKCGVCEHYVGSTKVSVDHIEPVIEIDRGFVNWDTFVARLFCPPTNLQPICDDCHQIKTNKERAERNLKKDLEELRVLDTYIVLGEHYMKEHGVSKEIVLAGLNKLKAKKKPEEVRNKALELLKLLKEIG